MCPVSNSPLTNAKIKRKQTKQVENKQKNPSHIICLEFSTIQ